MKTKSTRTDTKDRKRGHTEEKKPPTTSKTEENPTKRFLTGNIPGVQSHKPNNL